MSIVKLHRLSHLREEIAEQMFLTSEETSINHTFVQGLTALLHCPWELATREERSESFTATNTPATGAARNEKLPLL